MYQIHYPNKKCYSVHTKCAMVAVLIQINPCIILLKFMELHQKLI